MQRLDARMSPRARHETIFEPLDTAGGEPFAQIVDSAAQVGGEVLVVYAPFETVERREWASAAEPRR